MPVIFSNKRKHQKDNRKSSSLIHYVHNVPRFFSIIHNFSNYYVKLNIFHSAHISK